MSIRENQRDCKTLSGAGCEKKLRMECRQTKESEGCGLSTATKTVPRSQSPRPRSYTFTKRKKTSDCEEERNETQPKRPKRAETMSCFLLHSARELVCSNAVRYKDLLVYLIKGGRRVQTIRVTRDVSPQMGLSVSEIRSAVAKYAPSVDYVTYDDCSTLNSENAASGSVLSSLSHLPSASSWDDAETAWRSTATGSRAWSTLAGGPSGPGSSWRWRSCSSSSPPATSTTSARSSTARSSASTSATVCLAHFFVALVREGETNLRSAGGGGGGPRG